MNSKSTADHDSLNTARAWVDVDLGALLRNGESIAKHARVPLLPMVKADGYGLGVIPVVRALATLNPVGFGVATATEGRELRDAGVQAPVIVFTPVLPAELPRLNEAKLIPTLSTPSGINAWIEGGGGPWHLAIDTGLSRAGVRWDSIAAIADTLRRFPPDGAFTHFHSPELDDGSMEIQETRFREAIAALPVRPPLLHADSSAAIARRSPSFWNFVRPGVFLYGVGSGDRAALRPEQVVHLRARIVELHDLRVGESVGYDATWRAQRPSRVATLAVGYADGLHKAMGNRAEALVHGRHTPVIGGVMMDMTMIDVTDVPCAIGGHATLIGADGGSVLSVEAVAARADLSPYEVLTGLRQRITRNYS